MSINTITTEDLRRMEGKDGLILQGCGGDAQEWVDGINEMFTEAGILKDGSKFKDVSTFQYGELTCLLYPFEDVKLEIGKLAMWRLQTHETFGGTWLSDFVPNRLGGFIGEPAPEPEKPDCALIGQDGNIFNLVGIAARILREHDLKKQAQEMKDRVFASGSYSEALCIIGEYVNITDSEAEPERKPGGFQTTLYPEYFQRKGILCRLRQEPSPAAGETQKRPGCLPFSLPYQQPGTAKRL